MKSPVSPPNSLRRLASDTRAASAVEFALVVPLLFAIIFSTFELGWYMTQRVLLDHALDSATRAVRIGTSEITNQAGFKQRVCEEAGPALRNCHTDLLVEMVPVSTAADFPRTNAICVDRNSNVAPVVRFNPGARTETLFVRACLVVEPLTPGIGLGARLDTDDAGTTRIVSISAFVNEPE